MVTQEPTEYVRPIVRIAVRSLTAKEEEQAIEDEAQAHLATQKKGVAALNPPAPQKPPLPARAKRVLFLFMNGGPSHVDTFDPKPVPGQAEARRAGRQSRA
ncbi:MAG TPA: DUF1501 domain-containing protein [Chthonomonadaceae bacterium]|nr:DUF1501 domain-containing protein [Chthonomonadaceae bacterium]